MRASDSKFRFMAVQLAAVSACVLFGAGYAAAQNPASAPLKPSVSDTTSATTATAPLKSAAAKPGTATAAAKPDAKQPARSAAKDAAAPASGATKKKGSQSIVVLVGDDPITAYEIEQRQRLASQGAGIGEAAQARFQSLIKSQAAQDRMKAIQQEVVSSNPGKSREQLIAMIKARMQAYGKTLQQQAVEGARVNALPGLRQKALDQLIDEKLMLQEAKRVGVLATEEDVNKIFLEKAQKNKMTMEQYAAQLKSQGVDIDTLRGLYRAQMSWQDAIRRRFGYQIQVTEREVERVASSRPKDFEDDVELQLQRILLPMPEKLDQKIMAKRFQDADAIWRKFDGCKSLASLAAGTGGARLENLGAQRPSNIPEPTRGLLLGAADGSMLPPSMGQAGMELWAVCGRNVVKADEKQREVIETQLRKEQFGLLADRHLKDLRKDTPIEYR